VSSLPRSSRDHGSASALILSFPSPLVAALVAFDEVSDHLPLDPRFNALREGVSRAAIDPLLLGGPFGLWRAAPCHARITNALRVTSPETSIDPTANTDSFPEAPMIAASGGQNRRSVSMLVNMQLNSARWLRN